MRNCKDSIDLLMIRMRRIMDEFVQALRRDSASATDAKAHASLDRRCSEDDLRILIVSTPKTGNTWVKHLLSATYDLPIVQVPLEPTFNAEGLDGLGQRWIAHQHYYPVMSLLRWAEQENVRFVTTIRHPGDTLLSLYYHVHNRQHPDKKTMGLAAIMEEDLPGPGQHTAEYVRREFYYALNMSIAWMRSGLSVVVRYEDLHRDTPEALAGLTAQIAEVRQDRIQQAVTTCRIDKLRTRYDPNGRFFRKGAVGDWAEELPKAVLDLFHQCEPYPRQLAVLGYDIGAAELPSAGEGEMVPGSDATPCTHVVEADPASIPPIVRDLYASLEKAPVEGQQSGMREASMQCFLGWLNAPAEQDPYRDTAAPMITNLAAEVYRIRSDVQQAFPDIYYENRVDYAHWFAMHARDEYQLGSDFTMPIISSWLGSGTLLQPC